MPCLSSGGWARLAMGSLAQASHCPQLWCGARSQPVDHGSLHHSLEGGPELCKDQRVLLSDTLWSFPLA